MSDMKTSSARPMMGVFAFLICLGLGAPIVAAQSDQSQAVKTMTNEEPCSMKMDFSDADTIAQWRIVNDGVMGGRSEGTRYAEEDHMVFTGTINTNGGGFSSLRTRMTPGSLMKADGMTLQLRSDGRAYRMTFRSSERWRGRSVSYQAQIPRAESGRWTEVFVPFAGMNTSVFGRSVRANPFDPSDVREMGIILADGRDGPFRLDIKSLHCNKTGS